MSKVKVWYSLYGRMLSRNSLAEAFRKVKRSKGAGGIDHQSIEDFNSRLDEELDKLLEELRLKSYRPKPVRRVEIPKVGGGTRELGIPAVRDRVVQQALLNILQPIFNPEFHPSSYGYRPGLSCHHAITKATLFIRKHKRKWVVDMDLSKCFDTLNHDFILKAFRKRISDGSILRLLGLMLKSGVMIGVEFKPNGVGSPQGGVISPLIANVYLDSFDQFMRERKYRIVRYADDILILSGTKKSAERALSVARRYLEKELLLKVNEEKTHICRSGKGVKFLGVVIHTGYTRIQTAKVENFKDKVKWMVRRNSPINLEKIVKDLNPALRGFANYYRIANCKRVLEGLMTWIRRRLRAKQLNLWKKPERLHRKLRQLGYRGKFDKIKMNSWRNAASPLSHYALPNSYFHKELGLVDIVKVKTGISVS